MKIVFSTDGLGLGGKEKQLIQLYRFLSERGHEVYILTAKKLSANTFLTEIEKNDNNILELSSRNYILGGIQFKQIVRKICPDVIVNWDTRSALWSFFLSIDCLVINNNLRRGTFLSTKHKFLLKLVAKFSKYNLSNSKAGMKLVRLETNENNRVIYNGFISDSNTLPIINEEKRIYENIKRLSKHKKIFINIASFQKHKGQLTILEALNELNDDNIVIVLVGDGPEKDKIKNEIKRMDIEKQIILTGSISNPQPFLTLSLAYINSSSGEGCSNSIIEAMHSYLPIITTPHGGTSEIIFNEMTYFFNYGDHKSLKKHMLNLSSFKGIENKTKEEYKSHLYKFNFHNNSTSFENFIKFCYLQYHKKH